MPLLRLALAILLGLAATGLAGATEPDEPPVLEHTPDMIPDTAPTGFYARFDAGVALFRQPSMSSRGTPVRHYSDPTIDPAATVGFGAGLKATEWLRGDVTVDLTTPAAYSAGSRCPGCKAARKTSDHSSVATLAVLLNGYLDFAPMGPVTPYVGAGIGGAMAWFDDVHYRAACNCTGTRSGGSQLNLAWALSAGAAVELTPTVSLDLGYRYLSIGSVKMTRATLDDLGTHQVRLGARVGFW